MNTNITELQNRIAAAISKTRQASKDRIKALKSIRWMLREKCGMYAGLTTGARIILTEKDSACVFDGRDNEVAKMEFYSLITGGDFTVEVLQ